MNRESVRISAVVLLIAGGFGQASALEAPPIVPAEGKGPPAVVVNHGNTLTVTVEDALRLSRIGPAFSANNRSGTMHAEFRDDGNSLGVLHDDGTTLTSWIDTDQDGTFDRVVVFDRKRQHATLFTVRLEEVQAP